MDIHSTLLNGMAIYSIMYDSKCLLINTITLMANLRRKYIEQYLGTTIRNKIKISGNLR